MYEALYEKVVECCTKKGWTICKFERDAGIGNGVIGKLTKGRGMNVSTIVKIAKTLNVSVDYLLGITDEQ